ncbi:hypothetical protein Adt_03567 [Abeliophyllum distichum]|uniref:Uncharacterized protein n=1 Tax=Abeliophyllum distichum TaxID=126358 RepID=A0ABD1VYW5_9LAMI
MNIIPGLVLTKEVYNTLKGFDGKLSKEKANLKKLFEDLKVMSLEKAQLESDKRFFQVFLDSVVAKEADLKAKVAEAFQKRSEEAQKLVEERAFTAKTTVATTNNTFEAMVAEKDMLLTEAKEEIERVKVDRIDAKDRIVMAYQDGFKDTPKYKDLAHQFMTTDGD